MIRDIFSTPIYDKIVEDNNCKQILIKKLNDWIDINKIHNVSNVGGIQTVPFYDNILANTIHKTFKEYINLLNKRKKIEWRIVAYWINVNKQADFNIPHTHVDSNIHFSGIWYLNVPKDSGRLTFLNPDKTVGINNSFNYFDHPFTYSTYSIIPEDNKLIFFPSNVLHYVEPSRSKEKRISVAFNIEVK
jgi:uncharacterized protein (TIGR02466 family)